MSDDQEKWLSEEDAAAFLGVTPQSLKRFVEKGLLRAHYRPKAYVYEHRSKTIPAYAPAFDMNQLRELVPKIQDQEGGWPEIRDFGFNQERK